MSRLIGPQLIDDIEVSIFFGKYLLTHSSILGLAVRTGEFDQHQRWNSAGSSREAGGKRQGQSEYDVHDYDQIDLLRDQKRILSQPRAGYVYRQPTLESYRGWSERRRPDSKRQQERQADLPASSLFNDHSSTKCDAWSNIIVWSVRQISEKTPK